MAKLPTREELRAAGVPDDAIVDRSNHPMITASTWDVSVADKQASGKRLDYHLPHVRPASVLVVGINNAWDKGAWWRLQDMLLYTSARGHSISFQEVRDAAIFSFEAIPMMRWSASMMARDGGVEWCMMVDNDVWLEKDTLVRLLAHDRPVVFPYLEDMEKRLPRIIAPLAGPDITEPGHGLVPVQWAAMSCMLFNARIFNVLEPTAWRGSDFLFSQALNYLGHRIYVDTDAVVRLTKGPTRHASKTYDEFWADHRRYWDEVKHRDIDRGPPPGFNPLTDDGFVDKYGTYYAMPNAIARSGKVEPGRAPPNAPPLSGPNHAQEERKLWVPR